MHILVDSSFVGADERSFMSAIYNYRTAESVSPKHPDKICDQISDAILDAYIAKDPLARVAVDVAGGHGHVFVTGEVTSKFADVDIEKIVRRLAGEVKVFVHIATQSSEIAQGVDTGGAGDQGIMIGYATSETPEFLPLEVVLSRELNQHLYQRWSFDGKTQVTVSDGRIVSVVASFQHAKKAELRVAVEQWAKQYGGAEIYHINPSGDWDLGGFDADAGLTGRKLIVDNYGPRISIGGGAFSGKDPSKVDRSAAYMARKVAVDYLRAREASEVFVRLAYAIGVAEPLESTVIIDGVHEEIQGYDLTPNGIITALDLRRPIYEQTAQYGHFGHGFDWE
ncbi:MAG: methionine adenosyltransferase domain-containing protein [Candidatus Saccharibacteria bacterium]|jgi:S-adenosylmethionine synthetase|nr:MAG: methionine adenosyltransferase domain-containing protein [Candidatus Saccharibacteria bacterium]